MTEKEDNIIYTARDIDQYLAGNLSPQQMHAMEKAALHDPFLAEAMEGYEAMQDKEWNNHLVTLREAISKKGSQAKVIPLHKSKNQWWKAAAAVLLIGGTALFTLLLNNKEEKTNNTQTAQTINTETDNFNMPADPPPASVTESLNPTASESVEEKKTIPGSVAKPEDPVSNDDKYIVNPSAPQIKAVEPLTAAVAPGSSGAVIESTPSNITPPAAGADIAKDVAAEKNKPAPKQSDDADLQTRQRSLANSRKDAVLNNFFTAQVVSPDNIPLPFTNISIKKENFGTYADVKGMVRLVSTDSILQVEVNAAGYKPKTFALYSNQSTAKIILQEDETALKDKIVIGNAEMAANKRLRRAALIKDSVVNVEPADGWENYNTYVANNLDIPLSKLKGDVHGEVEISFDVKANGTISNIKINKSLGADYDEAAKRLILEGPQWKVKKGKKNTASVKLQF